MDEWFFDCNCILSLLQNYLWSMKLKTITTYGIMIINLTLNMSTGNQETVDLSTKHWDLKNVNIIHIKGGLGLD